VTSESRCIYNCCCATRRRTTELYYIVLHCIVLVSSVGLHWPSWPGSLEVTGSAEQVRSWSHTARGHPSVGRRSVHYFSSVRPHALLPCTMQKRRGRSTQYTPTGNRFSSNALSISIDTRTTAIYPVGVVCYISLFHTNKTEPIAAYTRPYM